MPNEAAAAAERAERAAAEARAAEDAETAELLRSLEAGGSGSSSPAPAALASILRQLSALGGLQSGVEALSTRLAALELRGESAVDPPRAPPAAPPALPAAPPPLPAGAHLAGGAPAAALDVPPSLAEAIADGIAKGLRQQVKEKELEETIRTDRFSDENARKLVTLTEPLTFFQLPDCARTEFPAPFRLETWRFTSDWPPGREDGAGEAAQLSVLGAWTSRLHNDLQAFQASDSFDDKATLRSMVLRAKVYAHQLTELIACRYDVLVQADDEVADDISERILSPADQHASKALAHVYRDVRRARNTETVKLLAAQRRGGRGRRGRPGKAPAAAPPKQ